MLKAPVGREVEKLKFEGLAFVWRVTCDVRACQLYPRFERVASVLRAAYHLDLFVVFSLELSLLFERFGASNSR